MSRVQKTEAKASTGGATLEKVEQYVEALPASTAP